VARPREFDETEVLDRALETFWSKGFDGTSIQDLIESTGLARASLYGAFGDKHQLYQRVLEHYATRTSAEGGAMVAVDAEAPLRQALEQLLGTWVGLTCPKVGPRGCFLALAGTQGSDNAFAREALSASLRRMEKLLVDVLRRGQGRGELAAGSDVHALARLLIVLVQGIATCARAGWSQDRLRAVVAEMLDLSLPK
jgi:TetR/AcrR family transcriptional regulator, transcriptional repressor for nem operon